MEPVLYFLTALGRPVALRRLALAAPIGLILIILFAWSGLRFWRSLRDSVPESRRMICWLMIGAYSVLTAALVTGARLGFGVEQALEARYTTFTLYLTIALVHLLPIILSSDTTQGSLLHIRFSAKRLLPLLSAALLAIHLPIYLLGIRQMSFFRAALLQSKACVLFANVVWDDCLTQKVYPDLERLKREINTADRLGFLRPGLVKSNRVQDIEKTDSQAPRNYGSFQSLFHVVGDKYDACGWAVLPHRGEPADAVLLAYERDGGQAIIFAIADLKSARDLVSALLRRDVYGDSRWCESFSLGELGPNGTNVTAWAFDAYTGKAYRLSGTHVIHKPARSRH